MPNGMDPRPRLFGCGWSMHVSSSDYGHTSGASWLGTATTAESYHVNRGETLGGLVALVSKSLQYM